MNIFDLTPHQLDVLRTIAACVGGVGGFAGGCFAPFAWLARKYAKQAAHQTATAHYVNGELRMKSSAETAEESLQRQIEMKDVLEYRHGRRRLPTDQIPLTRRES